MRLAVLMAAFFVLAGLMAPAQIKRDPDLGISETLARDRASRRKLVVQ